MVSTLQTRTQTQTKQPVREHSSTLCKGIKVELYLRMYNILSIGCNHSIIYCRCSGCNHCGGSFDLKCITLFTDSLSFLFSFFFLPLPPFPPFLFFSSLFPFFFFFSFFFLISLRIRNCNGCRRGACKQNRRFHPCRVGQP